MNKPYKKGQGREWDLVTPLLMMMMMTTMMIPAHNEVHWAYVPDPSQIHPSVWSTLEILMNSDNTQLLGSPWTGESIYNKTMTFTAFDEGIPGCIVKNSINDGYISVFPQTWRKKNLTNHNSKHKDRHA
jgi:hypothetical protein